MERKLDSQKLKIMQIAPIYIPITPTLKYGGIERVVLSLGKAFLEKGHNVITAAPADSEPYGELLPTLSVSEWTKPRINGESPFAYENHVNKIIDYLLENEVDIIHDHTGNFVLTENFKRALLKSNNLRRTPIVVTPHELKRFAKMSPPDADNIIFTALSEYQKSVFSDYVPVVKSINNGVFVRDYLFNEKKDPFLFSLGSIERDKGQDLAVKAALEAGFQLKIGGPIAERDFYDLEIKPFLGQIEYIGELNDEEKKGFFSRATASILPIRIGDCFTLTRIESLACGTPVVTLNTGSAKEAIEDGRTGYVVDYNEEDENKCVEGLVSSLKHIGLIDPYECRKVVEEKFDWPLIAEEYLELYRERKKCMNQKQQ
ncbi:glycosyltransferase [Candidatus Pacearchaeota archaeon]|nr:glycosyltransferase [Candidatus Pacearchaeota archaeon]